MSEQASAIERSHSPIGPSSFERVEACSASAIISMHSLPEPSSVYAAEGTAAHFVFEQCMKMRTEPWEFLDTTVTVEGTDFLVDTEMVDALTLSVNAARERLKATAYQVEVRLELPDTLLFGTSDLASTLALPARILDLKYGAGVQVSAGTVQLGLYALMALLRDFGQGVLTGSDEDVLAIATVLQPRGGGATAADHPWTRGDLRSLYRRVLRVQHKLDNRVMDYAFGPHCRWCPAVTSCPLLHTIAVDAALSGIVTNTAVPITPDLLDAALLVIPSLDLFAKRVSAAAQLYLEQGGTLKNAKLVAKRATREWKDIDATVTWLDANHIEPFSEPVLKSPAQVEKLLPSSLKPHLADYVTKESTGLTLAMSDDPRPAANMTATKGQAALMQQQARAILARTKAKPKSGD